MKPADRKPAAVRQDVRARGRQERAAGLSFTFSGAVQQQHAVAKHRGQLFHPAEQFNALGTSRVTQTFDHGGQIQPYGLDCGFQGATLAGGSTLRLARTADFRKVNDLCHCNTF